LEGSGRGLIEVLRVHLQEGTEENLGIAGVLEEITAKYLQDTGLERYRYANPLGKYKCNPQITHVTVPE
jgi:hypothetical protein